MNYLAAIKAAAYAAVAALGASQAIALLREVINEIENDLWSGPGSR